MFEGLMLNTLGKISTLRCFILENDEVNFEYQNDNSGFCMETRLKEASQAAEGELGGYCNDLGIKGGGLSFASEDAE